MLRTKGGCGEGHGKSGRAKDDGARRAISVAGSVERFRVSVSCSETEESSKNPDLSRSHSHELGNFRNVATDSLGHRRDFNDHFGAGGLVEAASDKSSADGENSNAGPWGFESRWNSSSDPAEMEAAATRATCFVSGSDAGAAAAAAPCVSCQDSDREADAHSSFNSGGFVDMTLASSPCSLDGRVDGAGDVHTPASGGAASISSVDDVGLDLATASGRTTSPFPMSDVVASGFEPSRFVDRHLGSLAVGAALSLCALAVAFVLPHWSANEKFHPFSKMDVYAEPEFPVAALLAADAAVDQGMAASPAVSRFTEEREAVSGFRTADMRSLLTEEDAVASPGRAVQFMELERAFEKMLDHSNRVAERFNELSRRMADMERRLDVEADADADRGPQFTPLTIRSVGADYLVTVLGEGGKRHILRRGESLEGWRLIEADFSSRAAVFEDAAGRKHRSLL